MRNKLSKGTYIKQGLTLVSPLYPYKESTSKCHIYQTWANSDTGQFCNSYPVMDL